MIIGILKILLIWYYLICAFLVDQILLIGGSLEFILSRNQPPPTALIVIWYFIFIIIMWFWRRLSWFCSEELTHIYFINCDYVLIIEFKSLKPIVNRFDCLTKWKKCFFIWRTWNWSSIATTCIIRKYYMIFVTRNNITYQLLPILVFYFKIIFKALSI